MEQQKRNDKRQKREMSAVAFLQGSQGKEARLRCGTLFLLLPLAPAGFSSPVGSDELAFGAAQVLKQLLDRLSLSMS